MTPPTDSRVQDVFDLSSEFVDQMAALRPMTATYQGIPGHDDKWDDLSPAGGERVRAFLMDYETRLRALPRPTERWARLATDVMAEHLKDERNWFDDGDDAPTRTLFRRFFKDGIGAADLDAVWEKTVAGWQEETKKKFKPRDIDTATKKYFKELKEEKDKR